MRKLKTTILIMLLVFLSAVFTKCSEDDPVPATYTISGQVTYTDGVAAGALVFLTASEVPTTTYTEVAVADAAGNYSFKDLDIGNYFLFANYDTENENIPDARLEGMIFVSGDDNLVPLTNADVTQNIALENSGSTGADVDTYDGATGWTFDKTHSSVFFEFPFDDENAVFEGHFDQFGVDIKVDENDLANSKIEAWVDVTTVKTTQPGRDGTWTDYGTANEVYNGGCIAGTFGAMVDGVLVEEKRNATWATTSIERYGDGFKAKGNFTFNGFTQEEVLLLKYIEGFEDVDNTRWLSSFEGELIFKPSDYEVSSGHIESGEVTIVIGAQLRQAL